ncbi:MAG: hypothetical protein AAF871_07675 [Pseudomonadota bacterium]
MTFTDIPPKLSADPVAAGLEITAREAFPFRAFDRQDGSYARVSKDRIGMLRAPGGDFKTEDVAAFLADQKRLDDENRYFFSVNRIVFSVRKPS